MLPEQRQAHPLPKQIIHAYKEIGPEMQQVVESEVEQQTNMFFIQLPFEVQNGGDQDSGVAGPEGEFVKFLEHGDGAEISEDHYKSLMQNQASFLRITIIFF